MSPELHELLFLIRQHPAFEELRKAVQCPTIPHFKESGDADQQYAAYSFRSGRKVQHTAWLMFLTGEPSQTGENR